MAMSERPKSQWLILNFVLKIFPPFPSSFDNFSFALSPSPALQKQRKKKNPKTHSGDLSLLLFLQGEAKELTPNDVKENKMGKPTVAFRELPY